MPDSSSSSFKAFASTGPGLESIAAGELKALGVRGRQEIGGVAFDSDLQRRGLGCLSVDNPKGSIGTTELDCVHLGHTHQTFMPPSTTMSAPVTYELSSDARNSATFATSSG